MVTLFVTSILLLVAIFFAIYLWQRSESNDTVSRQLSPSPGFEGLFADSVKAEQARLNSAQFEQDLEKKRRELLLRAEDGDKSALPDAQQIDDDGLYEDVLNTLVCRAENEKQVLALASYIVRSGSHLSINIALAEAFIKIWKNAPNRRTTSEMLHLAAMAGDAAFFQQTIELVLQHWREHGLQDITAEELVALIESEFWLIPSSARDTGAGFLLKRELAKIRRELTATETRSDK